MASLYAQCGNRGCYEETSSEDLLQQLIAHRTQLLIEAERGDEDEDKDDKILPSIPRLPEALQAIKLLISFTEGQDDADTSTLRLLERYKRLLERKESSLVSQSTLDEWISHS
ncbi:hypothetical protein ACJ73_09889 [Blastomyces percursus]|uniref:Uncharacterized protein n=1 Tax=Blastomyces percursus TaxID=1658174 RepID=A0A1J9P1J8_9EURO|nr:hypothetical protein ACJ73_09889 [Blastomyces percursus]